jgi:hypothetical protein
MGCEPMPDDSSCETDGTHGLLRTRFAEEVGGKEVGQLLLDVFDVGRPCDYSGARGRRKGEETVPSGLD